MPGNLYVRDWWSLQARVQLRQLHLGHPHSLVRDVYESFAVAERMARHRHLGALRREHGGVLEDLGEQMYRVSDRVADDGDARLDAEDDPVVLLDLGTRRQGLTCVPCQRWARHHRASPGCCERCARDLPLSCGLCRFCQIVLSAQPDSALASEQLWIGSVPLAAPVPAWPPGDPRRPQRQAFRTRRQARVTRAVSGQLADPAQLELFPAPQRDWRPLLGTALPALTPAARRLAEEFRQLARDQSWDEKIRDTNLRVLRVLVAWLGAAVPIAEADVRAVAGLRRSLSGHRVTRFLDARGMLVPDPLPQAGMDEAAVHRLAGTVPACFRTETSAWIRVLRGEGT